MDKTSHDSYQLNLPPTEIGRCSAPAIELMEPNSVLAGAGAILWGVTGAGARARGDNARDRVERLRQPCVGGLVEITPGVRFCDSKLAWRLETGNSVEMSQVMIHRRGAEDAEKTNESTL
jgi:hypothetical protein